MAELATWRLARTSRGWFCGTELGSIANDYVRYLSERGYAPQTISVYLEGFAHFTHWCSRRRLGLAGINEAAVNRFLHRHLPRCHCSRRCQRTRNSIHAALAHLLVLLRRQGRIAPKSSPDPVPIRAELDRFEHYLIQVCGLSPSTCRVRLHRVRAFLLDRFAAGRMRIRALRPTDVARFMRKYTEGWTPSSKRAVGDSLRSYFRFMAQRGEANASLSGAIPKVAQWRLERLPKGISTDQLARLLKAFDRNSTTGKRDYAITRCFVDLGLRTAEVARLRLDDIDWRQGQVQIHGKASRVDVLPLPSITGRAIVDYLRHGRPLSSSRALFMRHRPPLDAPATPCIVRGAVRYAAARCGLERCFRGPHMLRHTLAQRLVQGGTPFKEIADVLRHRSLDTTAIYAKTDFSALDRVALPWSGRIS